MEAYIDIETTYEPSNSKKKKITLIIIKHNGKYYDILYDKQDIMLDEFWDIYNNMGHPMLCAHNGIRFDFRYLAPEDIIIRYHGAVERPHAMQFYHLGLNYWYDTAAAIPAKLSDIGNAINLPKLEPLYYKPNEKIDISSEKYLKHIQYCRRDVDITSRWREFYPKDIHLRKTAASTAFHYLFHAKNIRRFTKPDADLAFHGGMTECFAPKAKDIIAFDINSSYGAAMRLMPNPYYDPLPTRDRDKSKAGVYHIEIESMKTEISPIAVLCNEKDLNPIPYGAEGVLKYVNLKNSNLWLASPELDFLDSIKASYTIKEGYEVPLFDNSSKIEWMHRQRENPSLNLPMKLLINSGGYGYFAQKDYRPINLMSSDTLDKEQIAQMLQPSEVEGFKKAEHWDYGRMQQYRIQTSNTCAYRNTLVAAYITSKAKMRLIDLMRSASEENVYYCDTDCFFTNDAGAQTMTGKIGSGLGMLKIQHVAKNARFYARKAYALDGSLVAGEHYLSKMKGLPAHIRAIFKETGTYTCRATASGWKEATQMEQMRSGASNAQLQRSWEMDLRNYRDFTSEHSKPYEISGYAQTRI